VRIPCFQTIVSVQGCLPVVAHVLSSFTPGKQRLYAGLTGLTDVVLCEEAPKLQVLAHSFWPFSRNFLNH
jgi:hypothetical protein